MVSFPASILRDLVAPLTYYVSTTGSDSNDGLTPATPFRHIMYAKDQMMRWNNRGTEFTIQCADGTYEERVILPTINGSGYANLVGNDSNPQNVIIWDNVGSSGNTAAVTVVGENYRIHGIKFISQQGVGLSITIGTCYVWNCEFGYCGSTHMAANYGGRLLIGQTGGGTNFIRVSGNAYYHALASLASDILTGGTPNQLTYYITAPVSIQYWGYSTNNATIAFSVPGGFQGAGNVQSGYKYAVTMNAVLSTDQVLPGTLAGYTNTGGQYSGP
jgi:hypothetical protein